MNNNKIGKFIKTLRKEKGLTQQELGNILYVTDKAVSKWERGLSLPDITILKELAKTLDVDVSEILNGERKQQQNNIDILIQEATEQIKINQREQQKKITLVIIIIITVLIYIIFKNTNLGYKITTINYKHNVVTPQQIQLGIPKLSFMMKNRDYSYSYKNLRSSEVVENELKKYLKTLNNLTCNNTVYYYNKEDNYSIIDYSVKDNLLYSTISYSIIYDDYCRMQKIKEYQKYISLRTLHNLNGRITKEDNPKNILKILLGDGGDDIEKYQFTIDLQIIYYDHQGNEIILEKSNGEYEIRNNNLIYYRKEITEQLEDLNIPEVSTFEIYIKALYLNNNYLSKYIDQVILR